MVTIAIELAVSYVSLIPETSRIAPEVKKALGGTDREFESAGKKSGGLFSKMVGANLASGAITAAASKASAGIGMAFTKGLDRLVSLDQARASLKGLGHDAASVETIMKSANAAVKGTAFGMGEASQAAANAVAAGVKPGQELERTLKLVGDAATIGGTGMGEMGAIFNKVAASNKIQMGEMNQLMDRGIPIQQMLADHLGVSVEQVQKLSSEGKIGFADFQAAMEKGLGGAALASGGTFTGALKNVQSAMGRIGAAFLGPAFAQMAPFFQKLIPLIDRLSPLATRAGAAFGTALAPALDLILRGVDFLTGVLERNQDTIFNWAAMAGETVASIGRGFAGLWAILARGDFAGVDMTFGLEEDSPVVGILFRLREGFLGLVDTVRSLDFSAVSDAFGRLGPAISGAMGSLSDVEVDGSGLQTILDKVAAGMGWVADNADKIAAALPYVIGGLVLLKGATEGVSAANNAFGFNSGWRTAAMFAQASATWAQVLATRANTAATTQDTAATNIGTIAKLRAAAGAAAHRVATIAATVATRAMSAGQWLLNAALSANPLGLIVLGIMALVGAIVLAWKNSETFRNVVMAVWEAIKWAAAAVVDWFVQTALPALKRLWDGIVAGFTWLKDMVVAGVTAMVNFVVGYFEFWSRTLLAVGKFIWDGLTRGWEVLRDGTIALVKFLVDSVVKSFNWWRDTLTGIVDNIRDWVTARWDTLKTNVTNLVTTLATWAVTKWTTFRNDIVALADNIRQWVIEKFDALKTGAEDLFGRMVSGIGTIWDGLKEQASKPVRFVIDTVINNGIIKGWNDLVGLLKLDNLKVGTISVPGFWRGGVLPGPGTSAGDDMVVMDRHGVPRATVASGEPVISREAYARNKPLIDNIIRGGSGLPAFFQGGTLPTPGPVRPHPLPYHGARYAADMGLGTGSPVYAWRDGTVSQVMYANTSYGNRIRANHGDAGQTLYAHLSRILVGVGQAVRAGQKIGEVGYSGNVKPPGPGGAHLHFEILGGNAPISASAQGSAEGSSSGMFDMAGQWITDKITSPVRAMLDKIPGAGMFLDLAKAVGSKLLDAAVGKLKSLIPNFGDDSSLSGSSAGSGWQGNANLLMQAGKALGASRQAMKIALMTAAQESSMGTNKTAMYKINGDGDVGWFQQRATRGDGTVAQLADPLYALRVFLLGKKVPAGYHVPGLYNKNWQSMGLGQAAQAVQVSAFPRAYDKWADEAEAWLNAFKYDSGGWLLPGVTMTRNETGKPEAVLTQPQWRSFEKVAEALANSDSAAALAGQFPSELVVVDADGALIGRMRVEAQSALADSYARVGGR